VPGVLRTRSGYCGGTTEAPNYLEIGDHAEAVSIDFDPTVVTYEELLDRFWTMHRCGSGGGLGQYRVAVFYHNEEQQKLAEKSRARAAKKEGVALSEVKTGVSPLGTFTYAEAYHQKHYLTSSSEVRLFLMETYPTAKELADSTVATRLNAYLGWGFDRNVEDLKKEIASYGLPKKLEELVLKRAKSGSS
jgi:methionine-S-sulfoxide reductase